MAAERPQYYENNLEPIAVTQERLSNALTELRVAANRGADLAQKNSPPPGQWGNAGLYLGVAGVALAFLRLDRLAPSLKEEGAAPLDFRKFANERIYSTGPGLPLLPSRLSPLGSASPIPAAVVRVLAAASSGSAVARDDISCLQEALDVSLKNPHVVPHQGANFGGDEILYGRTGLLWSLLNIRAYSFDDETQKALNPLFEKIPEFVDIVIEGGKKGREDYAKLHGEKDAMSLMYMWMEGYWALGSVHGTAGIVGTLLACKPEELNNGSRNHLPVIAETITALCKTAITHNGHLPMTFPFKEPSKPTYTLQVCHGSPGFLLLMACARRNAPLTSDYWQPEWDEAMKLAADRIWEEGLLSKGGGLCHGIAGNAWPLLFVHDAFQYDIGQMEKAKSNYQERTGATTKTEDITGDYFLSKGLTLLLHARETPPFNPSPVPTSNDYRMPDNPYALTEGLTGTACAWAGACVTIQMRLRQMGLQQQGEASAAALEKDSVFQELESRQLGFPTLPYYKAQGML